MDLATNNENVFINNSINYFYNEEQMAVTTFESINFINNWENYLRFLNLLLKFWNRKF